MDTSVIAIIIIIIIIILLTSKSPHTYINLHRSIVILDLLHFVYLARPLSWFLRYVLDPPIAH
jgi:hypothetical protein